MRVRRSSLIIILITACFFILAQCINNDEKNNDEQQKIKPSQETRKISFAQFAGTAKCVTCHKGVYESFTHTSHYLTSQPASEKFIKGSFEKDKNVFPFNDHLFVSMEKRDSGLYQVAYSDGIEKVAKKFDIVVGSGAKGQTYLSWRGNQLFQLPISFFTAANEWANSPGYPNRVVYNRPVTSRCMECHSTYAATLPSSQNQPEEFDHSQILYGVECEKCHGPGEAHVAYETQNKNDTIGKYIIKPSMLSRQQQLDLCALCHGGRLQKTKPSFEFVAGDTLSNYFVKNVSAPDTKEIDVHGNQFGLLSESKCFTKSSTMTCNTCHNSHENERGQTQLFSQRCLTCHNEAHDNFCKSKLLSTSELKKNCIDCHMPKQPSMSIALLLPGNAMPTAALIHTHYIKVYPEETKKFIVKNK